MPRVVCTPTRPPRSGFFELVTVSVFMLGIVAVAAGLVAPKGRDRWMFAGLLGLLCAFTLVILASALYRLGLYVDAYGLSRMRASVGAAIWWPVRDRAGFPALWSW